MMQGIPIKGAKCFYLICRFSALLNGSHCTKLVSFFYFNRLIIVLYTNSGATSKEYFFSMRSVNL